MALGSAPALGAISIPLAPNYDETRTTAYPSGDKPQAGCTINSGYTLLAKGTAAGEVCDEGGGDATVTASGADDEGDELLAYQSCSTADCQVSVGVPELGAWTGDIESFTAFGVEICESTADDAWCVRAMAFGNGTLRCKAGTPGPDDYNVNGSGGAPVWLMVTHDDSADELRCLQSANGSDWTTFGTYSRALAEPSIGGIMATSHSEVATTTATLTDLSFGTTITGYTPDDPDPGSPPTQTSSISNQSGTQGVAFSLYISGNFTGETSYSASGLPGSTGLSFSTSTGVLSGTPAAADVSASPYNLSMCGVNGDGSTCQSVQFTFSPAAGGGDTFTAPDVGNTTASTFNCASTNGANGSPWASIRTSGSGSTPGPGDTILITSGERGKTTFQNCHGSSGSLLTIAKTSSATRLQINGTSGDVLTLRDTSHIKVDGLVNWTGHGSGCGFDTTDVRNPLTDCGILIVGAAENLVRFRGERRFITLQGVELDGTWNGPGTSAGGTTGIFANDQTYCASDHPGEWMEGLRLNHNYIHDTEGPSTYIGMNISGGAAGSCFDDGDVLRQRDLEISYNYLSVSGSNGIHVKSIVSTDPTEALLHHNYVEGVGGSNSVSSQGANNRSLACFEASCTAWANVIDANVTDDPQGPGMTCAINNRPTSWGTQTCHFYNNVISNMQGHGINATRNGTAFGGGSTPGINLQVEFNTIVNAGLGSGNCIQGNASGVSGVARNNICAGDTTIAGLTQTNNRTGTPAAQNFVNLGALNLRLTSSSPARNGGTAAGCPDDDADGVTRPQGGQCDQGAYEFDE